MIHIRPHIDASQFVSVRQFRAASTKAHSKMGEYWHSELLPKHFHRDAKTKYGHKPRSTKYLARKKGLAASQRQLKQGGTVQRGGEVDNVFTGFMERMLKGVGVVRAYPTRVSVNMTGPRYVTMRVFQSNQPDKFKEISTTTEQERVMLAEVVDKVLEQQAAGW